jgi:hypothetical protein
LSACHPLRQGELLDAVLDVRVHGATGTTDLLPFHETRDVRVADVDAQIVMHKFLELPLREDEERTCPESRRCTCTCPSRR